MLLEEIFLAEHGRIVKGVNTTPDVNTGEIARQAKKWGFRVSKDGVPLGKLTDKPATQIINPKG